MKARCSFLKILGAFAVVLATLTSEAASANVVVTLNPPSIALGDSAQLTVTVDGGGQADPTLPAVRGLEFTPGGQSSSYQSVNGNVTSSVSLLYNVTPNHAGTFAIPPIRVAGGGSSQPLVLQVLLRKNAAPGSPGSNLSPPNLAAGTDDSTVDANGQPAFLRVVLPKRELYVGELVPVQVKAYFRAGMSASLNGLPVLSSDAFTLNKLDDKPGQSSETIGDQPYTVVTWNTALTAVKAGDYALNLELPVIVRVQEQNQHRANPLNQFKQFFGNSPFDDPMFNDPFFDNFFGGTTEKPLTLRTDADTLKILSLPIIGRPANFSGAVGKFEVSTEAAPTQLAEGDPVTLRLKVTGQGNFDRVTSRGLESSSDWKTYLPTAHFDPDDSAGYQGTKTFEQAVLPLKAGAINIPTIKFSYFDPDSRQYVTCASTPLVIEVAPASAGPVQSTMPPGSVIASQTPLVNSSSSDLSPNKIEVDNVVSSLRPLLFTPWFVALQAFPLLLLAAGFVIHRRRQRLARNPERIRERTAQAAVRYKLAAMEEALAANSAPAFFTAACEAVRKRLALHWHLSADQVTPAEINRRLNGGSDELRELFNMADAVIYSGRPVAATDLAHWKNVVTQQLKNLEQP